MEGGEGNCIRILYNSTIAEKPPQHVKVCINWVVKVLPSLLSLSFEENSSLKMHIKLCN